MIEVVRASEAHIPVLAANMRPDEVLEVDALGFTPHGALDASLRMAAAAWTGLVDDVPVCMFGVYAPILCAPEGEPWLLATDGILPWRLAFLRRNGPYIRLMLSMFPRLVGHVDDRNKVSQSWLRWLGFELGPPIPFGLKGEPFRRFWMEA